MTAVLGMHVHLAAAGGEQQHVHSVPNLCAECCCVLSYSMWCLQVRGLSQLLACLLPAAVDWAVRKARTVLSEHACVRALRTLT